MANEKQDSNVTGLRIAEELSLGVLPGTPEWIAYEPNTYSDFGGQVTTLARNAINESRQRQKGVTTDLDAVGGFQQDFVQKKLRDLLQGFIFADWRPQPDELVTSVTGGGVTDDYNVVLTAGFQVGNLILAENFGDATNNGLKTVDVVTIDTLVSVTETLANEGSPPADAKITVVGFEGAAGDIDVTAIAGPVKARYTSTVLDFTTLDLIPGSWIYVGGDGAGELFVNAGNNGLKRVFSIAANVLEIDQGGVAMVTEASTTETIHIFLAENLKNEALPALIKRRTYQLERTLGDDGGGIQSEYEIGAVPESMQINVSGQDKVTADITFIAIDEETRTGAVGVKTGNRPALAVEDAFNTSSDFSRLSLAKADGTELFARVTEFTVTLDNSLSPNKAIAKLGAFDVSAGQFVVGGSITAYFFDVAAKASIRNNDDIAFNFAIVKNNAGWVFDIPLITLGDGRLNVEQDAPITIPITLEAGADRVFNHTLLLNNFIYLPTVAAA